MTRLMLKVKSVLSLKPNQRVLFLDYDSEGFWFLAFRDFMVTCFLNLLYVSLTQTFCMSKVDWHFLYIHFNVKARPINEQKVLLK